MEYSCRRLSWQARLCRRHTRGCVASGGSTSYAAGSPSSPSTMISIALLRVCSQEVSGSVSGIPKLLQLVSTKDDWLWSIKQHSKLCKARIS